MLECSCSPQANLGLQISSRTAHLVEVRLDITWFHHPSSGRRVVLTSRLLLLPCFIPYGQCEQGGEIHATYYGLRLQTVGGVLFSAAVEVRLLLLLLSMLSKAKLWANCGLIGFTFLKT